MYGIEVSTGNLNSVTDQLVSLRETFARLIFCSDTALTSYSLGHLSHTNSLIACDVAWSENKISIRAKFSFYVMREKNKTTGDQKIEYFLIKLLTVIFVRRENFLQDQRKN